MGCAVSLYAKLHKHIVELVLLILLLLGAYRVVRSAWEEVRSAPSEHVSPDTLPASVPDSHR
jgi:hypothetical protein